MNPTQVIAPAPVFKVGSELKFPISRECAHDHSSSHAAGKAGIQWLRNQPFCQDLWSDPRTRDPPHHGAQM